MLHIEDVSFKREKNDFSVIIKMPLGRHDVFTIIAEARSLSVEGRYANSETTKLRSPHAYIKETQKGEFDMTIQLPVTVDFENGKARIFKEKLYIWFPYAETAIAGRHHIRF